MNMYLSDDMTEQELLDARDEQRAARTMTDAEALSFILRIGGRDAA